MRESKKANTTSQTESRANQLLISGKTLQKLCARILEEASSYEKQEAKHFESNDDHIHSSHIYDKIYTSIRTLNCIFVKRLHIKQIRLRQEEQVQDNETKERTATSNKRLREFSQQWTYKQICALHWIAAVDVESHIFHIENDFARYVSMPVIIFTPYENLEAIAVNEAHINNLVASSLTAKDFSTLYRNNATNKMNEINNTETKTEATLAEDVSAEIPTLEVDEQNSDAELCTDESKHELTTHIVNSEERPVNENTNYSFVRKQLAPTSKLSKLALESVSYTVTNIDIACVNNLLQRYYVRCTRNREQCQRLENKSREQGNEADVDDNTFSGPDQIISKLHSFTCVLCGRLPVKICTLTCCGALLCEKCVNYYNTEEKQEEEEEEQAPSVLQEPRNKQAQNIKESSQRKVLNNKHADSNPNKQVECLVCHELLNNVQVHFHSDQDEKLRVLVRCLKVMYKEYFTKSSLSSFTREKALFSDNNITSGNWQTVNRNVNAHNLEKRAVHDSSDFINKNMYFESNRSNYFTNSQQTYQQAAEQHASARSSGSNTPIFNVTPKMHHTKH